MERLRIGVIGAGGMGASHAEAIATLERATIGAVADSDEERGRKLAGQHGVPWFGSYEAMLESDRVDAVTVASPPYLHREMAVAAAARRKHVFCEKPLAVNVPDCEAIIAAAARAGVTLMVGQVLRYLSPFVKVLELVSSGSIGSPISAQITRLSGNGGAWTVPWRAKLEQSGGLLLEINAHEIDFLRCLCGDVASVSAVAGNYLHPDADYPDLAFVNLRFRSGAIGSLYSSNASVLGGTTGIIQGSAGAIRYDGWGKRGRIEWKRSSDPAATAISLQDLDYPPGVAFELGKFTDAVLDGTAPPVTGLDGLKVVEIGRAAYLSAQSGVSVTLPVRP